MQPVYNEFIQFLKDNGVDTEWIKEGYYWLDNNVIKSMDSEGNLHKCLSIKVDITHEKETPYAIRTTKHKVKELPITWSQTCELYKERMREKISEAIAWINKGITEYADYEPFILTSTGKDSMVVMDLVQKVKPCKIVFNNTTLDCADTYKIVKQHPDWIVTTPLLGSINGLRSKSLFQVVFHEPVVQYLRKEII